MRRLARLSPTRAALVIAIWPALMLLFTVAVYLWIVIVERADQVYIRWSMWPVALAMFLGPPALILGGWVLARRQVRD